MHAMSSDPRMQDYFMHDAMLGSMRVPARFFRTMHARKAPTLAPRCPLLLVHPGADAWTPTALSRAAFEKVRGEKEFVELTNGSHLPAEHPAIDELRAHVERFLSRTT
jgi:pimeloyl-ACP methyl ester carboxylesterase